MNPNARKQNETYESYRARLKTERKVEKERAKGRLVWDSQQQGTYVRAKHGEL